LESNFAACFPSHLMIFSQSKVRMIEQGFVIIRENSVDFLDFLENRIFLKFQNFQQSRIFAEKIGGDTF